MTDSSDLMPAWRAAHVRRWHMNADLAHTQDPTGFHAGRAAILAMKLWPGDYEFVAKVLIHDQGEDGVGDVASPVKQANPDIQKMLDLKEAESILRQGLPLFLFDERDTERLAIVDKLDAVLWAHLNKPSVLSRAGWQKDMHTIRTLAKDHGVAGPVWRILDQVMTDVLH